ncbi:hypothetical protein F5883DRAFT_18411 [Diaporthe sp. PMI_573]|nr:hypothetical protein F5883DRAFT_18411 [Diaporthaceae sp. PMI_573]
MSTGADPEGGDAGCMGKLCGCPRRKRNVGPTEQHSITQQQPAPSDHMTNTSSIAQINNETSPTQLASKTTTDKESCQTAPSAVIEDKPLKTPLQQALDDLEDKTRKKLKLTSLSEDEVKGLSETLVRTVREKEAEHKNKTPTLKIDGKDIQWRNHANTVVKYLKVVGDVTVPFAPAPASVVWSGVKTLLDTNVEACGDLAVLFGCADEAFRLFTLGAVYEDVYLESAAPVSTPVLVPAQDPPSQSLQRATGGLRTALVQMYKAILTLLCHSQERFGENGAKQFFRALRKKGEGDELLKKLMECEGHVNHAASSCATILSGDQRQKLEALSRKFSDLFRGVKLGQMATVMKGLEGLALERMLECISPMRVRKYHRQLSDKRARGTCEWLLQHPRFREWEDSSSSQTLWLRGPIGSGKSYLSSMVIDFYSPNFINDNFQGHFHPESGFAYFYCINSQANPDQQSATMILRTLIRQLAQIPRSAQVPKPDQTSESAPQSNEEYTLYIHEAIEEAMSNEAGRGPGEFSFETCKSLLGKLVNSYARTILVLDALDECDRNERKCLFAALKEISEQSAYPVQILIASRPENDIKASMTKVNHIKIEVSGAENTGDIERYIRDLVTDISTPGSWWSSVEVTTTNEVVRRIRDESDGMFRWAFLQWEQLKTMNTTEDIKAMLTKLPKGLAKSYEVLYEKVAGEKARAMLQMAIKWMVCAREEVTTEILLWVIRMGVNKSGPELALPGTIVRLSDEVDEAFVEDICQNMITKDGVENVWRFSHASVREYFVEHHQDWMSSAQDDVAIILVSNLIDRHTVWTLPASEEALEQFLDSTWTHETHLDVRNELQQYVTYHWHSHVREALESSRGHHNAPLSHLQEALEVFFKIQPGFSKTIFQSWAEFSSALYDIGAMDSPGDTFYSEDIIQIFEPFTEPIFGVCALGFSQLLDSWSDDKLRSAVNNDGLSLLAIAAMFGHEDLCYKLLDRGCDVNRIVYCQRKLFLYNTHHTTCALNTAVYCGHGEIAKLLLDKDANPDSPGCQHTALCEAVDHEPWQSTTAKKILEIVKLLLDRGADAERRCPGPCPRGSALITAISKRPDDKSLAQLLVQHGAQIPDSLRGLYGY